ncbi:predicted protein, partial [Nematostella vectensis]
YTHCYFCCHHLHICYLATYAHYTHCYFCCHVATQCSTNWYLHICCYLAT